MSAFLPIAGGPIAGQPLSSAKTLVAASGSYALTGTSASLERGYEVTATAGSYAFTGTSAALIYTR